MNVCISPNGLTTFATQGPVERLYAGTVDGAYALDRGRDGTWTKTRYGLEGVHVGSLASTGDALLAGAHSGGLYRSQAGSGSWRPSSAGIDASFTQVYSLAVQERASGTVIWAGTEPAGLFRSDDLGETWKGVPSLTNVADTDKWFFPPPPHIAHVKHVAFHPSAETTLYVSIEQGALLKSTDDGKTWHELAEYSKPDDPVYRDMHRVTIVPSDPKKLYLTGGNGLYISADAGATWKHVLNKKDRLSYPDQFFIDPRDENTLYIAGAATAPPKWRETFDADPAILRSRDAGATWQQVQRGLPEKIRGNIEAMTLAHGPHGSELFAGTATGEVFVSGDGGESWSTAVTGLPPISKGNHHAAFLKLSA